MKQKSNRHSKRVKYIQKQVLKFYRQGRKAHIYHGSTNSTRAQPKRADTIDASKLKAILEVNVEKQYVVVEPNVPLDRLIDKVLKFGMTIPVVSEFPGITVGGAVMGGAGESSSFKWGLFNETCYELEVVLGNGEKMAASASENPDLFWGIQCSSGTLGVITSLKLKLIPAKPYVLLTYFKVGSFEEAVKLLEEKTKAQYDFLDGIIFSEKEGTIMAGSYCNDAVLPISTFHKASDEWFYLHAQKITRQNETYEELIPLRDYFFRYDRGAFWTGLYGFKIFHVPFSRLTRTLLAPLFKTRRLYSYLHGANLSQRFMIQDLCMPSQTAVKFMDFIDDNFKIYPLWLCAGKSDKKAILSPTFLDAALAIDVGVWGELNVPFEDFVKKNRQLEHEVHNLGGRKVLYAHTYYDRQEFWKIYNEVEYRKLRKKYEAETVFPDVFDKVRVKDQYKTSHAKGLLALLNTRFGYKRKPSKKLRRV